MVFIDFILSSVTSFYSQITTVTKFGHINTPGKVSLNVVGVTHHDRNAAHGRRISLTLNNSIFVVWISVKRRKARINGLC